MNGKHYAQTQTTQRGRTCSLIHGSWRRVGIKLAAAGACALMAGQLLLPSVALAAEWVNVSGTQYDHGTAVSGEGWSWDGADDMKLNGYNGGSILAEGNLNIGVSDMNRVRADAGQSAIGVTNGDLTITADSAMAVVDATGETDVIKASGDGTSGGNVTIDGAQVVGRATGAPITEDGYGDATVISSKGGDVTIENGAHISVSAGFDDEEDDSWYGGAATGILATNVAYDADGNASCETPDGQANKGGHVTIDSGSDVLAKAKSSMQAVGIASRVNNGVALVTIRGGAFVIVGAAISNNGYIATGIESSGMGNDAIADIIVDDEETHVFADADSVDGFGDAIGIHASSKSAMRGGGIQIKNGTCWAWGDTIAVLAENFVTSDEPAASIELGPNVQIDQPENGSVRDYYRSFSELHPLSSDGSTAYRWAYKGQTIGTSGEGVIDGRADLDKIARVAWIQPASEDTPKPAPEPDDNGGRTDGGKTNDVSSTFTQASAGAITPASVKTAAAKTASAVNGTELAATGDDAALTVVAMGVAGATVAAAGLAASKRRG